jgi:L-amino acid N-acyltransferase YncA
MIRLATEADVGEIADIYNYYIQNTTATFEESDVTPEEVLSRVQKVTGSGFPWLVAQDNEKVIGYAYANKWNERAAYRHTAEVTAYLSPGSVSNGSGTKLYEELFSQLRELSIFTAIGGITLPNPASVAIHEKFGMKKVAHFEAVGYKFGKWLDVGYWQAILNA